MEKKHKWKWIFKFMREFYKTVNINQTILSVSIVSLLKLHKIYAFKWVIFWNFQYKTVCWLKIYVGLHKYMLSWEISYICQQNISGHLKTLNKIVNIYFEHILSTKIINSAIMLPSLPFNLCIMNTNSRNTFNKINITSHEKNSVLNYSKVVWTLQNSINLIKVTINLSVNWLKYQELCGTQKPKYHVRFHSKIFNHSQGLKRFCFSNCDKQLDLIKN